MGFRRALGRKRGGALDVPTLVSQENIFFQLESENADSYPGTGTKWIDLIAGRECDFWGDTLYNSAEQTIKFDGIIPVNGSGGANLEMTEPNWILIPEGTDISFGAFLRINDWGPDRADPGFWRNGPFATTSTNHYLAFKRASGIPHIRWSGTNILNVTTGEPVMAGEWIYLLYVIKSHTTANPGWAKVYYDGVEKYSVNHTRPTQSIDIRYLNAMYSRNNNLLADYKGMHFYNKALSTPEALENNNNLRSFYNL